MPSAGGLGLWGRSASGPGGALPGHARCLRSSKSGSAGRWFLQHWWAKRLASSGESDRYSAKRRLQPAPRELGGACEMSVQALGGQPSNPYPLASGGSRRAPAACKRGTACRVNQICSDWLNGLPACRLGLAAAARLLQHGADSLSQDECLQTLGHGEQGTRSQINEKDRKEEGYRQASGTSNRGARGEERGAPQVRRMRTGPETVCAAQQSCK